MDTTRYALIDTETGTAAVLCTARGVCGFVWPQRSQAAAKKLARGRGAGEEITPAKLPGRAGKLVADYFAGREVDFSGVPVDLADRPPFHARVMKALLAVGYGQTVTYGQLAARAGRPGAARAVGQAMAHNPLPVIVPCHRVLRSDGKLGGFSADEGVALKRKLLAMEGTRK